MSRLTCGADKCASWPRANGYCKNHTPVVTTTALCDAAGCTAGIGMNNVRLCTRHKLVATKYGLTEEFYVEVSKIKNCEACGSPDKLVIDHDHNCCAGTPACGKCYRGVLCTPCNLALGLLRDSEDVLLGLLAYMKK